MPAMDVRNQCSGFLYGLAAGSSMVQSGMVEHVLLVGGETHSAAIDLSTRGRQVASLFGDGAGAVVISPTDEDRGVRGWWLGADAATPTSSRSGCGTCRGGRTCPTREADGVGEVDPELLWAQMDGKLVFKNAVERMIQVLMQACWAQKIDWATSICSVFTRPTCGSTRWWPR